MRVTLLGDFQRHFHVIMQEARRLHAMGFQVLSPHDVAAGMPDYGLPTKVSDFMWVVAPDGYITVATSTEIGMAIAWKIPLFSTVQLQDETLRMYVHCVADVAEAVQRRAEVAAYNLQCENEARQMLRREMEK